MRRVGWLVALLLSNLAVGSRLVMGVCVRRAGRTGV